ncbi:hypothetical protein [Sinomicrobium oceani]|uniref:hypothetical protein n=1 Tax=Sinomicrobium oceani TaxID=1150368 RepID=UPI00227AFD1E|nr:hypothetical protein [Sinomicrobium oceani]
MKLKIILTFCGIVLMVFLGLFYFSLRNNTQDISGKEPYRFALHKTLLTKRKVILARNLSGLHTPREYLLTEDRRLSEGIREIEVVPPGTEMIFDRAVMHTNKTNGLSRSLLIGRVWVRSLDKEVVFEYEWGTLSRTCTEPPRDRWVFPAGIWQDEPEAGEYFVK